MLNYILIILQSAEFTAKAENKEVFCEVYHKERHPKFITKTYTHTMLKRKWGTTLYGNVAERYQSINIID